MLPTPAEYRLAFELAEDNFNTRQITPVYENGKIWMSSHGFAVFRLILTGGAMPGRLTISFTKVEQRQL